MKKYTELELKDILEKHSLWSAGDPNGVRANLREADLTEANLYGANLRKANLYGANLREADLTEANLYGANLRKADLSEANLREADLTEANLKGADLRKANLSRSNLSRSNLRKADLSEANLYGANLREADLSWAYLYASKGVDCPMNCPEKGSFIGFKKVRNNLIVELEITEDALRSSATRRKCRCSKAKVLSITNIDGTESDIDSARSLWDPAFVYTVGKTVEVPDFDINRWNECAPGIHFFISRQEAVDFNI